MQLFYCQCWFEEEREFVPFVLLMCFEINTAHYIDQILKSHIQCASCLCKFLLPNMRKNIVCICINRYGGPRIVCGNRRPTIHLNLIHLG